VNNAIRLGVAIAALAFAPIVAAGAETPRFAGKYRTEMTITYVNHVFRVYKGSRAVRTWTFVPRCGSGACLTVLNRPSIATASNRVFVYSIRPSSASQYRGSTKPILDSCFDENGAFVSAEAFTRTQTIVLKVTKVAAGHVVAFTGTEHTVLTPTAVGRQHRCLRGEQLATFSGSRVG
jgi:hypothetical protein